MINMKFKFEIPFEWLDLQGYGALRGYIEADSEEEARKMLEDEDVAWRYGNFEVDDYETADFELSADIELEEVG